MNKGLFITFEGIDGSGKSTQANMLYRRLRDNKFDVILTREPGGINLEICEKIRNVILNHQSVNISQKTELFLFMASRSQHVAELIKPSIKKGIIVICDRFADASIAYQGYGRGLDIEWIKKLNNFACQGVIPDRTFLLDIPSKEFTLRKKKDNSSLDRIERSGEEFQSSVRKGYLEIEKEESSRFVRFDGTKSKEKIADMIYASLETLLATMPRIVE